MNNIDLPQYNALELRDLIISAIDHLGTNSPESDQVLNWLYTPDIKIADLLDELKFFLGLKNPSDKKRKEAGYLLEKILLLAFKGLAGFSEIKSFRSASHQYDFLVSGDTSRWEIICKYLYIPTNRRSILAEAKAIKGKVSSAQFSRICSILSLELSNTAGLGILFTLNNASGFPARKSFKNCQTTQQLSVSNSKLCQLLFYAKHNKPIVVLDQSDIFELDQNGSFIRIIIRKIKEIENQSGLPTTPSEDLLEVLLPNYLNGFI